MTPLSSSGARLRGDDYHHIFGWCLVLRAIGRRSAVHAIGVEDPGVPGADDVTLYQTGEPDVFHQVKSAVDGRSTATLDWLLELSDRGGPSILQKFHRVWTQPNPSGPAQLGLVTNRVPADPFFGLADGRDRTVAARLGDARPGSSEYLLLARVADHLQVTEEQALAFLRHVSFVLGRSHNEWVESARELMGARGFRTDDDAVEKGIGLVRGWVLSGQRLLQIEEVRRQVAHLDLQVRETSGTLVLHALDRDPVLDPEFVVLDWVDELTGNEARNRRAARDPAAWNGTFRPALHDAARRLRSQGHQSVLVRGFARLPTWFAAGVALGRTAGFAVATMQGASLWSSADTAAAFPVTTQSDTYLDQGPDLAVGICISADLTSDVLGYLRVSRLPIRRYLAVAPSLDPSNSAIPGPGGAVGSAYAVRDLTRQLAQETGAPVIHLFLATPRGVALLLGHLWDRLPQTQLYEDLGACHAYVPSYTIPN